MTKQYLLMVDEASMAQLSMVLRGVGFIEVQGMSLGGNNEYKLMVTPVVPPLPTATITAPEDSSKEPAPRKILAPEG